LLSWRHLRHLRHLHQLLLQTLNRLLNFHQQIHTSLSHWLEVSALKNHRYRQIHALFHHRRFHQQFH
jgi:hypothetical protein